MARSPVAIEVDWPQLGPKFRGKLREVYLFMAAQIQTNRGLLFDREGARNGNPKWAPLKWRSGQILSKRGTLRKSIAPVPARGQPGNDGIVRISGEHITVGTKLFYARMMNDGTTKMPGGVLKPVHAKALKIPNPNGEKGFMFRKSVKIPARPFDQWTKEDQQEIDEALSNKIAQVLNS